MIKGITADMLRPIAIFTNKLESKKGVCMKDCYYSEIYKGCLIWETEWCYRIDMEHLGDSFAESLEAARKIVDEVNR